MKKFGILSLLILSVFVSGCAQTRLNAKLAPGKSFSDLGTVYVAHFEPDKRELHKVIATEMTLMGYKATAGEMKDFPAGTDTLVTYKDKWMWDMSNYMLQITIEFRDGSTKEVFVSGESYRTSLARREPDFMIRETLQKILANRTTEARIP